MGFQQDYKFPDLFDLANEIVKKYDKKAPKGTIKSCIINSFLAENKFPLIDKMERIKIDEGQFQSVLGWRVILSNGDIYETVFKDRFFDKESGNYACDYYEWRKVK